MALGLERDLWFAAARYAVGCLDDAEIVALAHRALEREHLPEAVCELVTIRKPVAAAYDIDALFEHWLREEGMSVPDRGSAKWEVARGWIACAAAGEVSPAVLVAHLHDIDGVLDDQRALERAHEWLRDAACPCCGNWTRMEDAKGAPCPVCFWEEGTLNLEQARANFLEFGARDRRHADRTDSDGPKRAGCASGVLLILLLIVLFPVWISAQF